MFDENIPIKVFTSYAHKDEALREELDVHLAMIKRQKAITIWNDRQIEDGTEWDAKIKKELEEADIILLLFTPLFLASTYIYDVELKRAMERHEAGTARVIPIIIKPCDWLATDFAKLQGIPKNGKPVTTWEDRDEVFLSIAQSLKKTIKIRQEKKKEAGI
ncbi:MAG: toll/interleukin-1 receptor domain-containing protein [Saprospiraceae bacterium]